jgi:enamine deaminase RidA (YjgF/YER057c/UK114 family)
MTVNVDTHSVESALAAEIYISATPKESAPLQDQASQTFSAIRDLLCSERANIIEERVFGTQAAMEIISNVRSQVYRDIDDGVAPTLLCATEGMSGPLAGVQVHAIRSDAKPEAIELDGSRCGRILPLPGRKYLTLSSISNPHLVQATEQADAILKKAESVLRQFGVDFLSVPRTWVWLCDILSWYDDFNQVRNKFFAERRLIGDRTRQSMPASTGIGLCLADGSKCGLDLTAVLEPADSTEYFQAVGKQQCALEYGSAFSRASRALTPGGQTVFVSGTASIDAAGQTTNIGDARGQIDATIENVRAVLRDTQVADENVVQAVAYCKTTEVEMIFNDVKQTLRWPCVTTICDICRSELLFEMEVTALKQCAVGQ